MKLLAVLMALCLGVSSVAAKEKQQEVLNFTPKPDGQTNKVTLTRGKVECTFEYASTGGTDEDNEKPLPSEEIVIEKGPDHVGLVRNADGKFSGALKQLVLETTPAAKKVEL